MCPTRLRGTIVFSTVGRPYYGFDIFSVSLPGTLAAINDWKERRLTDGVSINFNGHFLDEDQTLAFISERTGSPRIYLNHPNNPNPRPFLSNDSLFYDRPAFGRTDQLFFVSTRDPADRPLQSSSAVFSARWDASNLTRMTPSGAVDYSPAVSRTGKFIAVASYGTRPWAGDFHELKTHIVVFPESDPTRRTIICQQGGWPAWAGDSTIFFHQKADDGWWSIFRVDLPENMENSSSPSIPCRITPPGLHSFTPAASHCGKWIAVSTRRPGREFRHIEIFDLEMKSFVRVTESLNPNSHHYNPFLSPESGHLGYHRFRGELGLGESIIPHLDPVASPIKELRLLRLNGFFPSFSPKGDLIAFNHDFDGVSIVRSDGSKRWTVLKGRNAFHTVWSPTEEGVIYTSVGPIFDTVKSTVQIARITFDLKDLDDREEVPAKLELLTREDSGNNAFPSCSPDGKLVVFRSGRSGFKNLYVVDAVDGESAGGIRQLTDGPWIDTMPSWSPDGKFIAFSSNRHNPDNSEAFSPYLIRPDGTDLHRVYVAGGPGSADVDRERINHVCFSPDSNWLLFTANLGGVSAEPVSLPNQFQPYGELFVARLDGTEAQRLTWNAYEDGTPAWHGDGELEIASLSLDGPAVAGDKLRGQFEEPRWISCDTL